jgi:hypothetical protein
MQGFKPEEYVRRAGASHAALCALAVAAAVQAVRDANLDMQREDLGRWVFWAQFRRDDESQDAAKTRLNVGR